MTSQSYQDKELLNHVLDAIDNVQVHVQSDIKNFTVQRAVIYELITIGEAVKNLTKSIKDSHSDVPWQRIADSRHKMVHDYEDISANIVYDIVENHLPVLQDQIRNILTQLES